MGKLHRSALFFLAAALAFTLILPAGAVEVLDPQREGSLTIRLKLPDNLRSYGTLTLYRVGEIRFEDLDDPATEENEAGYYFHPVAALDDGTLSLLDLDQAELAQTAAELAAQAELEPAATADITYDDDEEIAVAAFTGLELGLYLVVQEDAASGYHALAPFLVSVPYQTEGTYLYDVTANAKSELEKEPESQPTQPPEPDLPQTGQLNWPIPTLAAAGMLLVAIGLVLRSKKREQNA